MTGQRFGRWTVLGMTARTSTDGHKRTACLCRCDCGTERVVYAQSLRGGLTKSCGCTKPVPLSALASQKAVGKAIFGKGWLISEKKAAEKKAAEDIIVWELSDVEREAVRRIDKKKIKQNGND